jgi:hypothetical protein
VAKLPISPKYFGKKLSAILGPPVYHLIDENKFSIKREVKREVKRNSLTNERKIHSRELKTQQH